MTYIIGGTPQSGKTTLRNILLERHKISGITTDLLREAFEYGVPEFGIKDGMSDEDKAEILWPYFKGMIQARDEYNDTLVIEGTNFIPEYLSQLKHKDNVRICFLGYADADLDEKVKVTIEYSRRIGSWIGDLSDTLIRNEINEFIKTSIRYREECAKHGIEFFDTSNNFYKTIDRARKFLVSKN